MLTLTDIIAASGYNALLTGYNETSDNIDGIFKAQSPSGVFYGGTAYNNNDFTSPDVVGVTTDWDKSGISLPLSGSDIMCGVYTFSYKPRLTLVDTFSGFDAGGYFKVTSTKDYSTLFGAAPVGMKLQIYNTNGVTTNEGTYDLTAVTFATTYTKFYVSGTPSTFTPDADDHISIIFETSNTFTYCYESPTTDIDSESSCIYSTLKFTDSSVYDVLFTGYGTITPTATRAWSIQCPSAYSASPVTAGSVNPLIIGYGTSYNSGADIWTGNYIGQLTSTLTYAVDTWGTGVYWVLVYDSIVSSTTAAVECDTCFCDIKQCVVNLYNRYLGYLNTNPTKALQLAGYLLRINSAWTLYGMEERCGGNYTTWCNEISAIVVSENCQCVTDTSVSKEVVPLSLQISGTGSCDCGITFGTGVAGFPLTPTDGDTHIFNATGGGYTLGDIYYYTSGAWVFQFNTIGAAGLSADVTRTSTDSLAIAIASKTFTYTSSLNLGWLVGTRLRAASAANATNYMEGLVTSVSATSVTINVDAIGGSGTFADWNIFIVGGLGLTGADGTAVLFDNTLETPTTLAGVGTYATFTGMTSGVLTNLATVGDKYIIKAAFETSALNKTPDTVKIRIDGLTLKYSYLPSPHNVKDIEINFYGKCLCANVVAEATVIDVAAKKLMVKYSVELLDPYANVLSTGTAYSLITLSSALNAVVVDAQGKIGASGTVRCRSLSVEFLNK